MNRTIVYKKCTKCGETKILCDNFQFRDDTNNWTSQCKKCLNSYRAELRRRQYKTDLEFRKKDREKSAKRFQQKKQSDPDWYEKKLQVSADTSRGRYQDDFDYNLSQRIRKRRDKAGLRGELP